MLPLVPYSPLMRSDDGRIFTVLANHTYVFPTPTDFFGAGLRSQDVMPVSTAVFNLLPYGGMSLAPGRLFQVAGPSQAQLWVTNGAGRLYVPTPDYLSWYGLGGGVIVVDATTAARYPSGGNLMPSFRDSGGNYFVAFAGQRLPVSASQVTAHGLTAGNSPQLDPGLVGHLPVGPAVTQFARLSTGAVYSIEAGQRHYIATLTRLTALGANSSNIRSVPDPLVLALPDGGSYN
jgi:hypothetical protein